MGAESFLESFPGELFQTIETNSNQTLGRFCSKWHHTNTVYFNFMFTLCLLKPVHTKNYNYKDNYISVHSNAQ